MTLTTHGEQDRPQSTINTTDKHSDTDSESQDTFLGYDIYSNILGWNYGSTCNAIFGRLRHRCYQWNIQKKRQWKPSHKMIENPNLINLYLPN
jgi:hypothetical protein